ncbi:histidine phosphatase family protein [Oceanobacillus arenosus]|uniref:Histidine phosphatase family protein n=1 Tax=Oceanobacillus arenosus TaxID=1229153 RepID=A0A3D8PSR6_9BACI|nr:histidine phosphatase family protein [Oceanobacillus arenosus]RDW18219.1 histidine phosphatase family protein [Oceanobacillus arenosus]
MQTNLYLVRHAHSAYTPDELGRPLSAQGFIDAKRISKVLENEKIDVVNSSQYKRAVQTVEGISQVIGKKIIIENGFKERKLAENPVDDFDSAILKVWQNPSFSWKGGESNIDAQKRGVSAIFKLLDKYAEKNIAVGTHGNTIVLIMNCFDEKYDFHFWKNLDMPDIYKLTFDKKVLQTVTRVWDRE